MHKLSCAAQKRDFACTVNYKRKYMRTKISAIICAAGKGERAGFGKNKLFAEREKALQSDGKKGKKKKVSSENLLR